MPNSATPPSEPTLYRKYRPRDLSEVLGQDHVVTVLRNELTDQKITHAYLFAGPRGTGKTTVARILAKRLNCERPNDADSCGTCAHCQASMKQADLDIIEIDAASNRGIDEIRALKERIRLAPTSGSYKVYIVDEVHMLTKEAFNALLKTLEEPPSHALFILATTEFHKVPDTIRSRCQTFLFRRAPEPLLEQRLAMIAEKEEADIDQEALRLIAHYSDGCFRDAESLLGQVLAVKEGRINAADIEMLLAITGFETVQTLINHLLEKNARRALELVHAVADRGVSLRRFADDVTRYLRALASFAAAGVHSESFSPSIESHLRLQARQRGTAAIVTLLRLFLRAKTEMRDATYEELPLELAIIEWCESAWRDSPPENPGTSERKTEAAQPATVNTRKTSDERQRPRSRAKTSDEANNATLFEKVASLWQSFLQESARLNPLLLSTLEACVPVAVRGNILYLITSYSLYRDRISDAGVRTPLEDILGQLAGQRLLLRVVHKNDSASLGLPEPQPERLNALTQQNGSSRQRNLTADALSVLGGEVLGS